MKCADCKWWDQAGSPPPVHHRCFRYPPVKIFDGEEAVTQWPWTGPTELCGEFTPLAGGKKSAHPVAALSPHERPTEGTGR